jgi:hypothetical protein
VSHGRTGLILRAWPELGLFNKVHIMYSESYELSDRMTSVEYISRTFKFNSRFRALLFIERIERDQQDRYKGTRYQVSN